MKINSLIKKTALAAAVAGASFAAVAGDLTITNPAVVANEIFGEKSETTAIRLPLVAFSSATGPVAGKTAADASIKLTLGGQVIFAENYQDANIWATQGVELKIGGTLVPPSAIAQVVGGTAGDNQVTIELNSTAVGTLDSVTLEGFQAQNLTSALARVDGTPVRTSSVTMEVRKGSDMENTPAKDAFVSINGVVMEGTATSYEVGGGRARIQVAEDQKLFTLDTGADAAKDFTGSRNFLNLGTLTLKRGTYNGIEAGKETGVKFDLTGADTLTLSLNADADLSNYKVLALQDTSCGTTPTKEYKYDNLEGVFEVTTNDINLDGSAPLNLCATLPTTGAAGKLPQASFDASMSVVYYNTRYTNSKGDFDYGRVLRNGCSVTLFNLPNATGRDVGNIRFTNTSDNQSGEVSVSAYAQDGSVLATDVVVLDNLDAHATALLQSKAGNGVDLSAALGDFEGRARIQINGAFPSCEALGLVSRSGGDVVNMTSTVYSGSANGTSNTDN